MTSESKRLIIIEDYNFTLPLVSKFEYGELIAKRILDIGKTGKIFISEDKMRISVADYDKKNNSEGKSVIKQKNEWVVVEDDTCILAKQELNAGKCPYLIMRIIKQTDDTVYAVMINPNELIHPLK